MTFRVPIATLPPRPTEAHAHPCAHCPSACDEHDPEALDLLAAPRDVRIEHAFRCAWRPQKLCRGYLDFHGLTEEDLR